MSAHTAPEPAATGGTGPRRVRVHHLAEAKTRGEKITMLTAYDAVTARIFDDAGIDMLLVGDSIGNTMHGHASTLPVTVDDLIPPARAVARAARRAFTVVDLPFGSYEAGPEHALATGVRFLKETGVSAVKLEGGRRVAAQIQALTDAGIPVVGHLGFTPQSENLLGGPRVQGRGDDAAERLSEDALAVAEAGAVAVVLEMVPVEVAARVTEILRIPTIGIGAGAACDGQVLVWTDMAGMTDWSPRFAKRYAEIGAALGQAAADYAADVRGGTFPDDAHSFARWSTGAGAGSPRARTAVGDPRGDAARDGVRVALAPLLRLHDRGLVGVAHLPQLEHHGRALGVVERRQVGAPLDGTVVGRDRRRRREPGRRQRGHELVRERDARLSLGLVHGRVGHDREEPVRAAVLRAVAWSETSTSASFSCGNRPRASTHGPTPASSGRVSTTTEPSSVRRAASRPATSHVNACSG